MDSNSWLREASKSRHFHGNGGLDRDLTRFVSQPFQGWLL